MASQSWKLRYRTAFEAYSAELTRQGWEPSTGSDWGDLRLYTQVAGRPEGWSEYDFNAELLRHGCEIPPDRAKWLLNDLLYNRAYFGRHKFFGQHALFLESDWREEDHPLDENWRNTKKMLAMVKAKAQIQAQKARDVQAARDQMKKERVDAGGTRTYTWRPDTWNGKLRHAYSSVLAARRPVRVAPTARTEAAAPSAASVATGTCLKQADALGGSSGAAGTSVAATVLIPNLPVRCLLEHV